MRKPHKVYCAGMQNRIAKDPVDSDKPIQVLEGMELKLSRSYPYVTRLLERSTIGKLHTPRPGPFEEKRCGQEFDWIARGRNVSHAVQPHKLTTEDPTDEEVVLARKAQVATIWTIRHVVRIDTAKDYSCLHRR